MQVVCSNCQSKIRVPDSAAGKKGKCPKCGNVITIPSLGAPTDEPGPEPVAEAPPGSPFDFSGDEPPPARKSIRQTDDAVEARTPSRKSKGRAADDEEEDAAADYDEDEDDRPRKQKGQPGESSGLSITSLILGIVSLLTGCGGFACCCTPPISLICGIAALVTGFLGMKKGGKVMAIIGMSLGGFSLLLAIGGIIFAFVGAGFANFMQMVGAR